MGLQGALDPQWENSEAFLRALGRLVAESGVLESQIDSLIWLLVSPDQRAGQIVTADLDFRRKVTLLLALLSRRIADDTVRTRIIGIVRSAHSMYDERNEYLHGMWTAGKTAAERGIVRVDAKKGEYRINFKDVDVAKIEALASRFNRAATDLLSEFLNLHGVALPSP